MKKFCLIMLFFVGIFASAKAQSYLIKPDALINATLKLDKHPPLTIDRPLYFINGKKISFDSVASRLAKAGTLKILK